MAKGSYHAQKESDVLSLFNTNENGLSQSEAKKRLEKYGPNEIQESKKVNPITIFIRQFQNLMVPVLLAAAGLSVYYHHIIDAVVIVLVIVINSIIGFVQEYRAENAIAALKKLVVQKAKVKRDGEIVEIAASEIVPGDIIVVEEGDKIPADARILSQKNALVSESLLTGESVPEDKNTDVLPEKTALADQKNMLFAGTILVRGSALAIVVETGNTTALGTIAKSLESVDSGAAHFQEKNSELVKQMSIIAFVVAILTFIVGFYLRGIAYDEILPFTLAALVSGIPESLPIIVIVVLSLSAHRMAKRNAIVRTLPSTETLSVVNVIITDKTGTLTQNKMTVAKAIPFNGEKNKEKLYQIASLNHNVRVQKNNGSEELLGDPTEIAFYTYGKEQKKNLSTLHKIEDFPFNQELKVRASLIETPKGYELFVSGAPESVIARSTLTKKDREKLHNEINGLTKDAMRTIGFAYKTFDKKPSEITTKLIKDLTWVGVVGMTDPLRVESVDAVKRAQKAGIKVIMATGDHPETAQAIGKQIGLHADGTIYTGIDIEHMTDDEVLAAAKGSEIFARMTPQAKMRLCDILQKDGFTVAMTGDGVNDAPALKAADVGIAMGKGGTDVSREASDIILADDNFATIIAAIEEGRTQFRNIRRTSFFLITTNLAESTSLLAFLILGLPLPLLPKQILWLNLVGSGVTDVALATEGIHDDVLNSSPRPREEKILTKTVVPLLGLLIVTMTISALAVFFIFEPQGETKARTGVFIILSLMQIMNMYNLRSLKSSVFKLGLFSNRNINLAFVASIASLLVVIYIPALADVFEFEAPSVLEFAMLFIASLSVLVLGEVSKKIYKPVEA